MLAPKSLIDVHVHLAALGPAPHEGFISARMRRSLAYRLIHRQLGIATHEPQAVSRAYVARFERMLAESRWVRAAVVLALDGVYDARGDLDRARTHLYVPNDAVMALARRNPAVLLGASVNPRRRDALDELERVAAAGAVLLKWLPNSQAIDPGDPANVPFYRALVRLRLPLLVHSGVEFTVKAHAHDLGHPARWRLPLDQGVDVIAAHGGSSGMVVLEPQAREFFALLERYPNLCADSSALLVPNRAGMFLRIRRRPAALLRLTFATDYPLPSCPELLLAALRPRAWLEARREKNVFDRQVRIFQALGWEPTSAPFERMRRHRG